MLQRFLDNGMLDIGEDDAKFKYLQQASHDLSNSLLDEKPKVISYTLVALDSNISPDEPVLMEVENAIKQHWNTLRNKFKDVPRQIYRAVIFEALRVASEQNETVASIVWLTGSNFLLHADLGRELDICKNFLSEMGNIAERKAEEDWKIGQKYHSPQLPNWSIEWPDIELSQVNKEELTKELAAAAGPQGKNGQIGTNPNPQWPNQAPQWSHHFAPRAAQGIAQVVNQSYNELAESIHKNLEQLNAPLNNYASAIHTTFKEVIEQSMHSIVMQERRSRLLWWRQTLYSSTLQCGYRTLDAYQTVFIMAYDLHQQVTAYSPQSVEYLLREAVQEVIKVQASKSISLNKFCEELRSNEKLFTLLESIKSTTEITGRMPLLVFIKHTLQSTLECEKLEKRVGISNHTEIELEDLAVWLFRDLQATKLVTL